jgi:hypothetical protein
VDEAIAIGEALDLLLMEDPPGLAEPPGVEAQSNVTLKLKACIAEERLGLAADHCREQQLGLHDSVDRLIRQRREAQIPNVRHGSAEVGQGV